MLYKNWSVVSCSNLFIQNCSKYGHTRKKIALKTDFLPKTLTRISLFFKKSVFKHSCWESFSLNFLRNEMINYQPLRKNNIELCKFRWISGFFSVQQSHVSSLFTVRQTNIQYIVYFRKHCLKKGSYSTEKKESLRTIKTLSFIRPPMVLRSLYLHKHNYHFDGRFLSLGFHAKG